MSLNFDNESEALPALTRPTLPSIHADQLLILAYLLLHKIELFLQWIILGYNLSFFIPKVDVPQVTMALIRVNRPNRPFLTKLYINNLLEALSNQLARLIIR